MDIEVLGESLRQGLRRHAAEVPHGLAERIAQTPFRPRRYSPGVAIGASAAATAVITAGALAGIVASGGAHGSTTGHTVSGGHGGVLDAQTVAYRTSAALEAASSSQVEHVVTTLAGVDGQAGSASQQWLYGSRWTSEEFAPGGSPSFSLSEDISGCSTTVRFVDYRRRTWYSGKGEVLVGGPMGQLTRTNVADQIRQEFARGQLRSVGHTDLSGRPAIELTGVLQENFQPAVSSGCTPQPPSIENIPKSKQMPPWSYTIWVDPSTYLPISYSASRGSGPTSLSASIDWLAATPANLARLDPAIPAGFTKQAAP